MKKWLDKYESPKAQNGIEGTMGGLTDKGFNYNPAWGGAWQKGGKKTISLGPTEPKDFTEFLRNLPYVPEERYEPSDAVKYLKALYATGSIATIPFPEAQYLTQLGGATGDFYTGTRYAFDKNWSKAGEDYVQGLLGLIPYSKAFIGLKGEKFFTPLQKLYNAFLSGANVGSDVKTVHESVDKKQNGGMLQPPVAQMGGYVYPTTFVPQAEMGTSLPGSVGFTYARTQGIPSEGPYGKKTVPSAQNGQEMQFYQQGLDWTPRNISEDGSEIPMAQTGDNIPAYLKRPLSGDIQGRGMPVIQKQIAKQAIKEDKEIRKVMNEEGVGRDEAKLKLYQKNYPGPTIGPAPYKSEYQKKQSEERRQAYDRYLRSIGRDPDMSEAERERNIKKNERLLKAIEVATLLEAPVSLGAKALTRALPEAFVPVEGMMYRGIGKKGFEDAVQSGVFRPRVTPKISVADESGIRLSPKVFDKTYYSPDFKIADRYGKGYIAEVPSSSAEFTRRYSNKDWSYHTKTQIPINEGRILKKDLLRGYKEVPKKEEGGVVKDDMGYWNPDNWGKVVEIDSPNITMKGVNQDLIGVSDEGDVKYMEPGKDYKFKGKKVKEYPVAKYGVNQQDEKTVQHLDQLLNFTNKPKAKNGWLDKYK